jgi:hypothetical protein
MGFQPGAERTMEFPDAIVIGAGPAGLAVAASLQMQELRALILDKTDKLGSAWRRHYDRLHLHTDRSHSGLPGLAMSSAYGRYPSRAQFIEYLELYAARWFPETRKVRSSDPSCFPPYISEAGAACDRISIRLSLNLRYHPPSLRSRPIASSGFPADPPHARRCNVCAR